MSIMLLTHACVRMPPTYTTEYQGRFIYSWEGGGFFLPCDSLARGLGRRFFAQLQGDSLHWPRGLAPDARREGAQTFVILRAPRGVNERGDTLAGPFGARVITARPVRAGDCSPPGTASTNAEAGALD